MDRQTEEAATLPCQAGSSLLLGIKLPGELG